MRKYILDTNVYIEAHRGYYHPDIVPVYWDVLKNLGKDEIAKSPKQVRDEIKIQNPPSLSSEAPTEDRFLYDWARNDNKCFLENDLDGIEEFFRLVQQAYEKVKEKNTAIMKATRKGFKWSKKEPVSDQDMFVIATALFYKKLYPDKEYVIVTKENDDDPPLWFKPAKIPHICKELGVPWIDDFQFLKEVGIVFSLDDSSKVQM